MDMLKPASGTQQPSLYIEIKLFVSVIHNRFFFLLFISRSSRTITRRSPDVDLNLKQQQPFSPSPRPLTISL